LRQDSIGARIGSVVNEERDKMKRRFIGPIAVAAMAIGIAAVGFGVGQAPAADGEAAIPYLWQNCTHVHTKYRHGVGKVGAHDRTSGTPVTTFYRSTRLYNRAMSYNRERGYNLDRDHDGIACEKR
jgi:Excalibur calcium-binding domain